MKSALLAAQIPAPPVVSTPWTHSTHPGLLTGVSFTLGEGLVRDHRKSNPGHSIFFIPHTSLTQTTISQIAALYIDLDWSLTVFFLQDPHCLQTVVGYFCKSLAHKGSNSLRGSARYIELYNVLPRDTACSTVHKMWKVGFYNHHFGSLKVRHLAYAGH